MKILKHLATIIICIVLSLPAAKGDDWRGWRGLEKQAVGDSVPVAVQWSATKNVLWKTVIPGEGYSSPVVDADNVYVTAAEISRKNMNLSFIILSLIALLGVAFILKNVLYLIKHDSSSLLSRLALICTYGLYLFVIFVLLWMFRGERTFHKVFINYLFSGAVVLLTIIMTTVERKRSALYNVLIGVITVALTVILINYRPSADYFNIKVFFTKTEIWLFPVSISCLFLPVLASLYLLLKEGYRTLVRTVNKNESTSKKFRFHKPALIVAFIIAALGFFIIPVISLLKLYVVDADGMRIRPTMSPSLLVDPEFAFPFFLIFLAIGFMFWLILMSKPQASQNKKISPFMVLLPFTLLFFVMINYSRSGPQFFRLVYCIDRQTGEIKWKEKSLLGPAVKVSNYNSQATPTALVDKDGIYVYFGSAGMFSTSLAGKIRWENKNLPYESNHGIGSSPIFCDSSIIILNSMVKNGYITALNKQTGSARWKTDLPTVAIGEYRSPVLYKDYIVEFSGLRQEIVLYDKKNGQPVHKIIAGWDRLGEAVTTPLIINDVLIMTDVANIVALDLNKLITGDPDPFAWQTRLETRGPETSSPVYSNGLIFLVSDNGFATCVDFNTGKILWQKRLRGSFLSSPVISGNKVYFSNNAGVTTVVECAPEYRKVAENNLEEGIYATLAPVNGQLYIRTKSSLWCIRE